jgi:hypothetical protein
VDKGAIRKVIRGYSQVYSQAVDKVIHRGGGGYPQGERGYPQGYVEKRDSAVDKWAVTDG